MVMVLAEASKSTPAVPANAVTAAVSGVQTPVTAAVSGDQEIVTAEDTQ